MPIASLRSSPRFRVVFTSLSFALLAAVSPARAADADAKAEVPIVSTDEAVQKELVNLERLLDANPKLEETLRNNLDQLTEQTFRAQNPEIDSLLKRQPGLVKALKTEPHYFVHRSLVRLARAKVTRKDVIALDDFLSAHPDIAKELRKKPGQIVNGEFLIAHPALAKFFEGHPALSSVLLKRAEKAPAAKADAKKK